jgi:hypothetical protein
MQQQTAPAVPNEALVKIEVERVVRLAASLGVVVTVEQKPLLPLKMGNYETVVTTRPAHK